MNRGHAGATEVALFLRDRIGPEGALIAAALAVAGCGGATSPSERDADDGAQPGGGTAAGTTDGRSRGVDVGLVQSSFEELTRASLGGYVEETPPGSPCTYD
jgi:hypothetical protein